MKTALVFSAGGMFGAWQAGAWKALAPVFQPDLVVGASAGALNAWAVAGGCAPEELCDRWLHLDGLSALRWQFPRNYRQGLLDSRPLHSLVRDMYIAYRPVTECAIVVTQLPAFRPVLIRGGDIEWQHLAASVAVPGFFEQMRVGGKLYSDGGLAGALPIWAAVELGATHIVAIDVLPELPNLTLRLLASAFQRLRHIRPAQSANVVRIGVPSSLGTARDAVVWSPVNAQRWIAQGEAEGTRALHEVAQLIAF